MTIEMMIVDEEGLIKKESGTQKIIKDVHPVWKARNAIELGIGSWIYAPGQGHSFADFKNVKASDEKVEEFQKVVRSYLSPYGPEITDRYIARSQVGLSLNVTKETLIYG